MIDFPGKVACIVFTLGCNFRCSFCHNPEFVLQELIKETSKNLISEKAIFNFLEKRKWMLDWVSICWGEPTLQKDLYDFCKKVKNMWYVIKLDTNWRDPDIINKLIDDKLVDYVAMDIKNPIWKFKEIVWVEINEEPYLQTIKVLLNSDIDYEFRTTFIKGKHNLEYIEQIAKYISWAKNYYIQNFQSWNTLDPNFTWKGFTKSELKELEKVAKNYVKNVEVRD